MLSNILSNIKKARMKKFYINLSISFPIFIFSFSILKDSESNLIIFGVFGIIAALFCVGLALKELVSALNCENSIFFLRLNRVGNKLQIANYFEEQLNQIIIEDENVIITPELFVFKKNYEQTLINDEIADVTHLIHKTNFAIDYISIIVLYSDGKKYEIKYKRPFGPYDMNKKAKDTSIIANILANNCNNLRKKK